jgi:formate hydrogenlyase subunit 6
MKLLGEALRNLFRRSFTQKYPKVKPEVPEGLRGKLEHFKEKCIYCGWCEKQCPSAAITVDIKNKIWTHDLGKCLFCAQCEEVCHEVPKKDAIKMTPDFELAEYHKSKFFRHHRNTKEHPGQ